MVLNGQKRACNQGLDDERARWKRPNLSSALQILPKIQSPQPQGVTANSLFLAQGAFIPLIPPVLSKFYQVPLLPGSLSR